VLRVNFGLADDGTFSYTAGQLSLHISTPDFKADATFPLNLTGSQATMPFKVFSSGKGTSLWDREALDLGPGIQAVYNASVNASNLALTPAQAGERAFAYAEAWLSAPASAAQASLQGLGQRLGRDLASDLRRPRGKCTEDGDNCITGVQDAGDDILIHYSDAPASLVMLYSDVPPAPGPSLGTSALAGDPRVYLDPEVHPDSQFDPVHHTAVIIDPEPSLEQPGALAHMVSTLKKRHYEVTELDGTEASIERVAGALASSPGVVIFSTHGNKLGQLLVGNKVTVSDESMKVAYAQYGKQLAAEGLGSLAKYQLPDGTPAYYLGDPNCSFKLFQLSTVCQWNLVITPGFWAWLTAKRHVNWSSSLVFISACETDLQPLLRAQVRAKAYFAFSQDVAATFATGVEEYLLDFLAHPTRSPEEAYYNLVRLGKTREMIYKEDHLLNGLLGPYGSDASTAIFDGWGWNGTSMVDYDTGGWLGGTVDPSQVWWMLFAARWDTNASLGAAKLQQCYSTYWSKGRTGGLADQFCNAATIGLGKSKARLARDVSYAVFLLMGKKPGGFLPNLLPPRWTMDD